jgi:hypothetical protein
MLPVTFFRVRYAVGDKACTSRHWSAAWELIRRVQNTTIVSARYSVSGPIASGTTRSGATTDFG